VLDVSGLSRKGVLNDISLQIRSGEIVGLAGLIGSGRSELARAIAGADPVDRGTIAVDGTTRHIRSPADAMAAGWRSCRRAARMTGCSWSSPSRRNTTFADLRSVASHLGVVRRASERARQGNCLT